MHLVAANLCQLNFDQVKLYMVYLLPLLLVLAFCRCCCLHFVVAAAAACMHFATAAWIKMLELYIFSESLFVVNCKVEWDVGWKLM